jgi:salicylate hydroxylase
MLRCQQVIDSSRSTGQIFCGQYPDDGLDPEKLKEALAPRWNFLVLDHEVHVQEALNEMERLKTAVHKAALS